MGEDRKISAMYMYAVRDVQSDMSPVGNGGEQGLCHVCSGGHSVTHVPSGGWGRRGGSLPCPQWAMLRDTCPQWGMAKERRICPMYAVADAW